METVIVRLRHPETETIHEVSLDRSGQTLGWEVRAENGARRTLRAAGYPSSYVRVLTLYSLEVSK